MKANTTGLPLYWLNWMGFTARNLNLKLGRLARRLRTGKKQGRGQKAGDGS